ncbi:hypothetical protein [Phascolarctobacterium succinatutens]|nr:hypothetical protein [Phascolarctobacterium succinatutens]
MLFGINADAAKTFAEICGEKQAKIQEKICGTKKILLIFGGFYGKNS